MKNAVVTFGEVLLRLNAPDHKTILQALPGPLDVSFAGAEANVAVVVSMLGGESRFVSKVPDNPVGRACVRNLNAYGVDTRFIIEEGAERLGTMYVQRGASQRGSSVLYDRTNSAFIRSKIGQFEWDRILSDAKWFHFTGITPALGETAIKQLDAAILAAKKKGVKVSCDLNFRSTLWNWRSGFDARKLAKEVMPPLLEMCDVLIGNEQDAEDVLGIRAGETESAMGRLDYAKYADCASEITSRFPQLELVAFTLRESVSATHNRWGAMLYDCRHGEAYYAPNDGQKYAPYDIGLIVDRVGAGDAFAGSLIFALTQGSKINHQESVRFAAAASCLSHTTPGDFFCLSYGEVEALKNGATTGRVQR